MRAFEFHRPATLKDAAALLRKHPEARPLAGGQTLMPAMKLPLSAPPALVSLDAIAELRGAKLEGVTLSLGAMMRHAEIAAAKEVAMSIPALARVAAGIGDRQVRNMGTLGGALANSDPAADWPAAVLGLGATIRTNKRDIPADRFFTGLFETALKPGELITAVTFPLVKRAAYVKFRQPASRFALVGVFVSEGGGQVRVAVTGAAACAFRAKNMEKALSANFTPEALARTKVDPSTLLSDIHGAADYRAHLVGVLAKRAVEAAISGR